MFLPRFIVAASFAAAAAAQLPPTVPGTVVPAGQPAPVIAAAAYLLHDNASGQSIVAQNADLRRDPASLTKLMTAYLTFGALREGKLVP
jgi:D-alanyl-D-alanine carboxypeptidase (penicillin-binding protein 5/6)